MLACGRGRSTATACTCQRDGAIAVVIVGGAVHVVVTHIVVAAIVVTGAPFVTCVVAGVTQIAVTGACVSSHNGTLTFVCAFSGSTSLTARDRLMTVDLDASLSGQLVAVGPGACLIRCPARVAPHLSPRYIAMFRGLTPAALSRALS